METNPSLTPLERIIRPQTTQIFVPASALYGFKRYPCESHEVLVQSGPINPNNLELAKYIQSGRKLAIPFVEEALIQSEEKEDGSRIFTYQEFRDQLEKKNPNSHSKNETLLSILASRTDLKSRDFTFFAQLVSHGAYIAAKLDEKKKEELAQSWIKYNQRLSDSTMYAPFYETDN
jgi:hypothetical protein